MSTETTFDKNAEKVDVLFEKVYAPVFMQKLAENGIVPQDEEEAQELFKIAAFARLHAVDEAEQPRSVIKEASASLEAITMGGADPAEAFLSDDAVAQALR